MKLDTTPATIKTIFEHYEGSRKNGHRPHLGGSQIGKECARELWYQFRHAWSPIFPGRILRLFETGEREEERLIANLRAVGVQVWDRGEDGGQWRFEAHGGHFALSLDGVGQGFKESAQPHVLEFKTMNDKNFKSMEKDGLQKSKPVYWAQVQIGMYLADLKRAYFFAVNKNDDSIYGERVKLDEAEAMKLLEKARSIIFSDAPPVKLSDDPSFWQCKFCSQISVCHNKKLPEVNCRTCVHATAEKEGGWSCAKKMTVGAKKCTAHIYNHHMIPWEVHDAGDDWVEYITGDGEVLRNCEGEDTSVSLFARNGDK